jgi:hypothetical protein
MNLGQLAIIRFEPTPHWDISPHRNFVSSTKKGKEREEVSLAI